MATQDDCGYADDSPAKSHQRVRRAPPRYSPSDYNARASMEEIRSELSQLAVLNPNTTVTNDNAKV